MRLSGMNFNVNLGDMLIHVDTCTLTITDNSGVSKPAVSLTAMWTAMYQHPVNWL